MNDELYQPTSEEVHRSMAVLPEQELMRIACAAAVELGWRGHVHPAAWLSALQQSMSICDPHILFGVIALHTSDIERPEALPHEDGEHEAFVEHHRDFVEHLRALGYDVDGLNNPNQGDDEDE